MMSDQTTLQTSQHTQGRIAGGTIPAPAYGGRAASLWRAASEICLGVTPSGKEARRRILALVMFLPALLTTVYYGFIASDRYVSEAMFVVRSTAKPSNLGGLTSLLQMTGMMRSQDDAHVVHEFMTSRDGVTSLEKEVPLKEIYGRKEADFLGGFPSLLYDDDAEDFYSYYKSMVDVSLNSNTGISTLRVEAFRPDDAARVATVLLDLSEKLVNAMNERIHTEAVRAAEETVELAQKRVIASQLAMTEFRNKELTLDPSATGLVQTELISRLTAELVAVNAQIAELEMGAPTSPRLKTLRARASALQAQIQKERGKIGGGDEGIARQMQTYEGMMLEHGFANEDLARAFAGLELARADGRRQHLFLERTVQPSKPDAAKAPERLKIIATALILNLVSVLMFWLIRTGIKEHGAQAA